VSEADRQRAVPYLVLGESARKALAESVRARIERWRNHWLPERPMSVRVDVLEANEQVHDIRFHEAACFRLAEGARPSALLLLPNRCVPQIAGASGDVGDSLNGPALPHTLAAQLELESLRALAREFRTLGTLDPTVERLCDTTALDLQRRYSALRYVSARVTLGESKCPLMFLLSPELIQSSIPGHARPAGSEVLERRSAAIADECIGIEALLGEGEVLICDLARLAVGDVIVLDRNLTEPAVLSVRGGGRIAAASPGKVDACRAVQIKQERNP
jgi:hypothetical protein